MSGISSPVRRTTVSHSSDGDGWWLPQIFMYTILIIWSVCVCVCRVTTQHARWHITSTIRVHSLLLQRPLKMVIIVGIYVFFSPLCSLKENHLNRCVLWLTGLLTDYIAHTMYRKSCSAKYNRISGTRSRYFIVGLDVTFFFSLAQRTRAQKSVGGFCWCRATLKFVL